MSVVISGYAFPCDTTSITYREPHVKFSYPTRLVHSDGQLNYSHRAIKTNDEKRIEKVGFPSHAGAHMFSGNMEHAWYFGLVLFHLRELMISPVAIHIIIEA
jgi:hypothetical protein